MASVSPRVLVTRAPHQASALVDELRARGAEPVVVPTIETVDPSSFEVLDRAIGDLGSFDWLLFTSANAVAAFGDRLHAAGIQCSTSTAGTARSWKTAAIGPATARALDRLGLSPGLIPPQAVAESLTEALLPHAHRADGTPTRFLLIRAEEAREHLPEALRRAGGEVTVAPAYRTAIPEGSLELVRSLLAPQMGPVHPTVQRRDGAEIDAVAFTSSSTARNLLALCEAGGVRLPGNALRISIGPITSQTLRDLGVPPHAEAAEATVTCLAETVMEMLRQQEDVAAH